MQTIQLTENGLKQGKNTSWTFHRCKSIKIFNLPYGHWTNFIQILLLFKNYAYLIDHTSQEINSKKLHVSYILHILHISCTKILCPTSFILPTIYQGFPNRSKGVGGEGRIRNFIGGNFYWVVGTWGGLILMIRNFSKAKNTFLWILNIN